MAFIHWAKHAWCSKCGRRAYGIEDPRRQEVMEKDGKFYCTDCGYRVRLKPRRLEDKTRELQVVRY
jgi:DNA-directed RNA polymerase subunit RPC12/RpoP